MPQLLGIDNEAARSVTAAMDELGNIINKKVATSNVMLTIYDPVATDNSGNPIRMVCRAETNLGDLCADAFRAAGRAEIGIVGGGGIRTSINKGSITYGDLMNVFPFGNYLCVIQATGQQILDALEPAGQGRIVVTQKTKRKEPGPWRSGLL